MPQRYQRAHPSDFRSEAVGLVCLDVPSVNFGPKQVLAPFGARFSASGDPFRPVTIRSVHADGDTVIVLWDGWGTANDGKPYENSYAWFMKMRDGKVIDGTAFYDSISFNELWSRVQPR